jgi:hypothetical protein
MEGGNFDTGGVPQLRLDGIKHGVSEFVADNIRAFAGVDSRAAHGAVEEVQTIAVVVGVEINAFVGAPLPGDSRCLAAMWSQPACARSSSEHRGRGHRPKPSNGSRRCRPDKCQAPAAGQRARPVGPRD